MVTWIALFALIIGVAGFAYTWKLHQELNTATRRLDRYNRALFDADDELRRLRAELAAMAAQLRVAIKQGGQQLLFRPDMSVAAAQALHPQAAQVMAGLHLGGCSSCAVDGDETLAQACAAHGVDLAVLLERLEQLAGAANADAASLKLPNLELSF